LTFDVDLSITDIAMLQKPPRLISGLRAFFGVFMILFSLCLAISPLGFIAFPRLHVHGALWLAPDTPDAPATHNSHSPEFQITRAQVDVRGSSDDAELRNLSRFVETPLMIGIAVGGIGICYLLRRLCRNVERGDVFSTTNVVLLRKLGWVIVVFYVGASLLEFWRNERVAAYVAHHTAAIHVAPTTFEHLFLSLAPIAGLVLGLLTLVLAEVFRYGLTLKDEADLTV
jgi:hypothetical protein